MRVQVAPHLIVGDLADACTKDPKVSVVHACKFPCHRDAVRYEKAPPKDHPEYLTARRGRHLYLNIIDSPDPTYIPEKLVEKALAFIALEIVEDRDVIAHCNMGQSRAPGLALLYLVRSDPDGPFTVPYDEAKAAFQKVYPGFQPGIGVDQYLRHHWPMKG